ncbi:endolysin [Mycobacterium phage Kimona]|uniref:Lysin A n=1 Tax=Mycobacterium phage Kimona TaxID=2024295 RepID=A0A249XU47_9CAUD|nr:endolysin [Mycobacterium phage Kimona]ASZ75442.1 lysin A [Mycobacterium phage Kimona]
MTERVLRYDHNIVPQETGWDCGPAAAQSVLSGRGQYVSESDLIREIGTTTRGTDYVGLIERALDRRVPEARYTSVYIENDPPTQTQKDRLWEHIVRSIDNGWGVIMNWVAPPSNKPRGVKGSPNPRYSGGTTYHYVACMGYDDTPGARALWIADSGFWPYNYWISFDQAATLIPPKGYAFADLAAVGGGPVGPDRVDVLARATGLDYARAAEILPAVSAGLRAAECTNVNRIAMYLAQVGHESDNFNATEEYDHGRKHGDPNEVTDRWKYKGRTWIMLTWASNYAGFSRWCFDRGLVPTPTYFVDNPRELADLRWAGLGAAWYWTVARPQINALADRRDLNEVTRLINGAATWEYPSWLKHRKERYDRALAQGDALLTLLDGEDSFLSALSPQEQRALYDEIMKRGPSRSFLADDGKQIETLLGFIYNIDGNAWNIVNVLGTLIGVESCVEDVRRAAEGRWPEGSYVADNPWLAQFGQEFCKRLLPLAGKLSSLLAEQDALVPELHTPAAIETPAALEEGGSGKA